MQEDLKREYIESPAYLFLIFLSTFNSSAILELKKEHVHSPKDKIPSGVLITNSFVFHQSLKQ